MLFRFFIVFFISTCMLSACQAKTYQSVKHGFNVETVFSSLDHPWGMDFLPGGRLLITQRSGQLNITDAALSTIEPVAGMPRIREHGQGGLLDVLVHPDYENNRWIYLSLAGNRDGLYGTEVIRARLEGNSLADIKTVFVAKPKVKGTRHFGSRLVIDDQGYLFISLGDRGQRPLAQQLDSHIGSLIRLHDDGTVPESNPFAGQAGVLPEIYSYGHRNIQGMAIRDADNSLWTHEHGPQGGDELNRPQAGKNYGWPVITYGVNYGSGSKIGQGESKKGMEQPVHYWVPSIAPSGMMFYQADKFPGWKDNLFIGSLKFSTLVRLQMQGNRVIHEERLLKNDFGRIRDVRQGPDGLIYILTDASAGKLLRLTPDNS